MRKLRLKVAAFLESVRSGFAFRLWLYSSYAPIAGSDAGSPQLLANIDAALKDLYLGPIVEQLNNKTYMLDQIQRDSEKVDFTGRRAVVPIRVGRNTGRGARGDNSTLPLAGRQMLKDAIIPIRYHYFGIEISDPTIEATKRNEGAFISAMELETEGVTDDARKDMNREIYGQLDTGGATGLLATVTATANSTTVTVDSVQFIQIGDPIDVRNQTTGTAVTGGTERLVTGRVGGATKTFAVTGASINATATNDGVYIAGARGNEGDGLRGITAPTGVLHSLNPASDFSGWAGAEFDAATATAGESLFEQLADAIGSTGRGEVDVFITSRGIRRRLADTYQSQKRFNDARATQIHGGYSAIMVNEIPVVADDDCPRGFAFGINKSSLKWYELSAPSWLEQGNGQILTLKDDASVGRKTNVWQGFLKWYAALGTNARNRNGRIKNAADDNPA